MKLLILGKSSYTAELFLNQSKVDTSIITLYKKKFDKDDIMNLDENSFFSKYFLELNENFQCTLNFIHIHESDPDLEIIINSKLCTKFKFAFNRMKVPKNIFLSSVNSSKHANTAYGKAKFNCEEIYRTIENSIIVRSSTIIEIDFENKLIKGGKKGRSLGSLNSIIDRNYLIPVPGKGDYLQTVCFGDDLGKFLNLILSNNRYENKTVNFFTGEFLTYNQFLNIIFNFKKIKRFKIFIPIFFINYSLKILNFIIPRLNISNKNIENLTNQKIEFDYSNEIKEFIKLKKFKDLT